MKKFVFIMIVVNFFAVGCVFAQSNQTGPNAKNNRSWVGSREQTVLVFKKHDHATVTGAKAKNQKTGDDDCGVFPVVFGGRSCLRGPEFKNSGSRGEACCVAESK
jgi:hypothetical protein